MAPTPPGPLRGPLYAALTGDHGADVSGAGQDVRGMLLTIGGRAATKSGIDLTKAAAALGVTRRTVERWVQAAATGAGQRPSPAHAKALAGKSRQAATTQAGRRAALQPRRARHVYARGARLTITGRQGLVYQRDYQRYRSCTVEMSPADVDAMLDAWERGGDKGFLAWATAYYDANYVSDWQFDPSEPPDDIKVELPHGGGWR